MTDKNQSEASANTPNTMMLRRTLILLVVCGIVAFCVLGLRLVKLQLIDHDFYETKAIGQQVRSTKVAANRGTIYDTNMKILAKSASVYDIIVCPAEITKDEDAYKIAAGLSEILGVDYDAVLEMTKDRKSWYKVVARKVEPEVSEKVRAYRNENKVSGIVLAENSKRYYPYGSLAAHVIGFVGMENKGQAGLESVYNKSLTGVDGRVVRAKNAAGTDMLFTNFEDYYDAMDGHGMVTTMDSSIQYYLEKQLTQAVQDFDVQNGAAAIAMDVDTGGILGMVSLGNFDLNNYQEVSEEVKAKIEETSDEAAKKTLLSDAQQLQWRNKALSDTYEPGSTFKIITMAMALNEGVVDLNDHFYCGGSIKVAGDIKARNCWKLEGHGDQTLTQALQHSCNVALVEIGMKIGAEKFYEYCEAFGLFDAVSDENARLSGKTGIDLLGESSSIWWSKKTFVDPNNKSQLAAASFGQTFNITPLQLITAVSAVTNGGYLMKPYVVSELLNTDGSSFSKTEPTAVRQVISAETSATMRDILEKVVSDTVDGTGKNASVAGYRIGGKTGTSTNTNIEAATGVKQYIVSFIGVAPMDDPEIAILILLDSPSSKSGVYVSGGRMGAPTVGKMFADILPYMGFEPIYSEAESKTIDRSVPNITGMTNDEAIAKAAEKGFTYRIIGAGTTVTKQIPAANSIVAADSQIIFYCDAEPSATQEVMPDLSNLSYSIARQRLGMYALYIKASIPITNPNAIIVTSQSIPAGTLIDHGTVIEVSVADTSNQGRY